MSVGLRGLIGRLFFPRPFRVAQAPLALEWLIVERDGELKSASQFHGRFTYTGRGIDEM
jgi:hypothetical protein